MDITIRFDATPELLRTINSLSDAITRLAAGQTATAESANTEQPAEPEPEPAAETEIISLEVFRKAIGEKSRADATNKERIKGILKAHGYEKTTDVKPEDRKVIMDEAAAI